MGFETVVRPVVFPNIRPAAPRVLPPVDDPTKGFCTITGSGGGLIDLPHTISGSSSVSQPHTEVRRQVDKERIYQMDENGKINQKNFVEVERVKKVKFKEDQKNKTGGDNTRGILFADPPEPRPDNIEILESYVDITNVNEE